MDRKETLKIMSILKAAFPAYYRGISREDALTVIALWQEMFANDDAAIVAAGVKALIATQKEGYPPTVGAVREKINQITKPETNTEMEAWDLVRKAVRRSAYNAKEEFAALPPVLQRIVRSPEQLRDWALMSEDALQSVVASNFQRSYRAKIAEVNRFESLPEDIKALANSFSEKALQQLPFGQEAQKNPEPKPLPFPERTKEDIAADIKKMQEIISQNSEVKSKILLTTTENISSEEWEENRKRAIETLKRKQAE